MPCSACPFNDGITEEATQGQNYGCLPTKQMMLDLYDFHGIVLSCHDHQNRPCSGLSEKRLCTGLPVLPYSKWHSDGVLNLEREGI